MTGWCAERDHPKSVRRERMRENFEVFDFDLTQEVIEARRHRQALLARLLLGCDVESLDHDLARAVGALAARAAVSDIVDVAVVEGALRRHDLVVSSDPDDPRDLRGRPAAPRDRPPMTLRLEHVLARVTERVTPART